MPTLNLQNENDTLAFGKALADLAVAGDVITLSGPLGAGKTVLARGFIARRVGAKVDVTSPTFTLAHVHDTVTPPIWHFDFYRLKSPKEVEEIGLDEALAGGISLIEWPERATAYLPQERLDIELSPEGASRIARLSASSSWETRLERLLKARGAA
ncbi:MAG: tRNA (adenosine(37)-N6)-threonylcarbamoyltransferase complex ATPase subunit type 1 TsaE [Rhodospirillaceae bacterium]|nr:tRNA (adenosine(37)-N6)-threonylcarbamoyltransferase complex ATPase subunit type 1 TsaE [Rhodospirillaceae bacterium]